MRKGIVKISSNLLMAGIKLPSYWEIESIHMERDAYATAVISGPEFPEVLGGEYPKQCKIIVHQEVVRFEVIPEEDIGFSADLLKIATDTDKETP